MRKWITANGCIIYQTTKGRGNSYLVLDNDISILVDTGLENSREELMEKLDHLIGENNLSYLVLTHTHYDHVGSTAIIKEKYGSKTVVQSIEAENLIQGNSHIPNGTNILTSIVVGVGRRINRLSTYEKASPDIFVDNCYSLTSKCYLVHTPGHTKGSMSLIVDDEVALVGDAMFGVFWWSVFPPFADDVPTIIKNWGKLLNTGCKLFLPGHGTENSRELLEKQYNKYKAKYI
jgi:glyoxylase-like metal-dependent hydrolase (beta-lactamase superfamily II)